MIVFFIDSGWITIGHFILGYVSNVGAIEACVFLKMIFLKLKILDKILFSHSHQPHLISASTLEIGLYIQGSIVARQDVIKYTRPYYLVNSVCLDK